MIYHIVNREFNSICMIDDEADNSVILTDDTHTYGITNGTLLNTFDCAIDKNHEDAGLIQVGTHIVFQDENGENICLTLMDTDEDEYTRTCHYEDLGMELINETPMIFPASFSQPVEYYVNREIYDSGWEIGLNELVDAKMKMEFTNNDTTLTRLQQICEMFKCEMYFTVEFQNLKVTKKRINIVKQIGVETNEVLNAGVDLITVGKHINVDNLKTALIVTGGSEFNNLVYNDGNYFTRIGESIIYDREANALWGRGHTTDTRDSGWVYGNYQSQSDDPAQMFAEGLAELKKINQPEATYTVEAIFSNTDFMVGDRVTIIDEEYNPALRISARILQKDISRTNPSNNGLVIGNVIELQSAISAKLRQLQNQINQKADNTITTEMIATEDGNLKNFEVKVYKGNADITANLENYQFYWKLTDKDGNLKTEWIEANKDAGNTVSVHLDDVRRDNQISCQVMYAENKFVQAIYFWNGLKKTASKIMRLQNENTVTIPFITDIHYATDTFIQEDLENYGRTDNHIKNVAELSHTIPLDCIVGGGDFVDGGTTKDTNVSNYKKVVSMFGLANCPFFLAKGNHDDNSWGDGRQGRGTTARNKVNQNYMASDPTSKSWHGNMSYTIKPSEMYEIITRPSTIWAINENPNDKNMYFYYDIPDKKVRVFLLNTNDIPYVFDTDGLVKYLTINVAGYRQAQLKWFAENLKSMPDDYTAVCFQHHQWGQWYATNSAYYPYNWESVEGILKAAKEGSSFTRKYTGNADFASDISITFDTPKNIAFLAHGHHHTDRITTKYGITNVSTSCSVSRPKKDQRDRPLGELEEDLWDVFVLDTMKKHVDIVRYGAGSDRSFGY
ncbi:phage minor structural protein, N-terminal domain protein [Enterococcus casseliflavus ATCC 12755]|uniref:Phage minor structural protein, N-terminal domain protein n=1 Tax=Enterococcus casseliflavus ATCC 12755 TaxID=888066 RepID=F0EII0_ENTCA|nr:phage tail spike protein [Enterococcus casseliflavus]EGC69880.1 phage minor structural protein, N-terminal domain protein [Enterococcus casseliflavus ATCC 12755]